eukprot:Gregarina_sp_Poly_1__11363@NODE_959_length_5551_cov_11_991247_g679_i0_p4_GENE_NODE_959_length_5551_cov_11_991247_g679_i0NODE_959_length_5551_cov_11_991247_g679_i0_p4_ORF_typecomplete_len109_score6_33_NODE_959_length_5551_cov_11_991247_g679_i017452071
MLKSPVFCNAVMCLARLFSCDESNTLVNISSIGEAALPLSLIAYAQGNEIFQVEYLSEPRQENNWIAKLRYQDALDTKGASFVCEPGYMYVRVCMCSGCMRVYGDKKK